MNEFTCPSSFLAWQWYSPAESRRTVSMAYSLLTARIFLALEVKLFHILNYN